MMAKPSSQSFRFEIQLRFYSQSASSQDGFNHEMEWTPEIEHFLVYVCARWKWVDKQEPNHTDVPPRFQQKKNSSHIGFCKNLTKIKLPKILDSILKTSHIKKFSLEPLLPPILNFGDNFKGLISTKLLIQKIGGKICSKEIFLTCLVFTLYSVYL